MEQILKYIQTYSLPVFVIATCIIILIGILKLCKVFDKIKSSNVKKFIYYLLDVVLAFGGVAIYFAIFKIDFSSYIMFSITQIGATTTLYAIYENFGIRKIVRMFFDKVKSWIAKNPEAQFSKWAKKIGLDKGLETIQSMIAEEANKREEVSIEEQKNE